MPTHDTLLIFLACGHTRKAPAPSKDEYYCANCDKHSSVKDVVPAFGHYAASTKMPLKWRTRADRK